MSGPIQAGPKAIVWAHENRFSSKAATRVVPIKGLEEKSGEMCGEYVCVSEKNILGKKLSCPAFGSFSMPGDPCFAQKFVYYTLDRFVRLLAEKLVCDIDTEKKGDGCEPALSLVQVREALKNRKMPLPVTVNSPQLVNAYYSPRNTELVFGDGEGKFLLATDGDIVVHEAGHWIIDTINPTLGSSWMGLGLAIHEGCADAIAALHFGDPQMAEDFNIYKHKRGYKGGLRTLKNTRTIGNIGSSEPHEMGKVIGGFWWSLYERIEALLKKRNPSAFRKNPAYFGQIARNATMKLVLAHVGSYSVPSPDAPDFLEAVSRGATDLNFIDALPELTKNNIGLMAVLNAIKAEGKRRGLDEEIWPDRPSGHPHAEYSAKTGPSLMITAAGGEKVAFKQQLYDTAHGPAVVVGHGTIVRNGTAHGKGLRRIAPKEIDEEVVFSRFEAYKMALSATGKELASLLASRNGDAEMPVKTRKRMLAKARKTLENGHHSGGKLAVLPGEKKLSWLFDAGVAEIAVDAKTGKAKVMYKGFVD